MPQKSSFNRVWNYLSSPIQEFANVLSSYSGSGGETTLKADTKEVVLTNDAGDATLTFSEGTAVLQTSGIGSDLYIRTLTGDDIILESGDDIRLQGDKGLYDNGSEGGDINLYAGDGSDGNAENAGNGGDVRIEAGSGGNSVDGDNGYGGVINIQGGSTTLSNAAGGDINIIPGNSLDGISGNVYIGNNFQWSFDTNKGVLYFPTVTLADLPLPSVAYGTRAIITDSTVAASGKFGNIVVGGSNNVVPVFSDGTNWLIG